MFSQAHPACDHPAVHVDETVFVLKCQVTYQSLRTTFLSDYISIGKLDIWHVARSVTVFEKSY
jgi:hypothetical protein